MMYVNHAFVPSLINVFLRTLYPLSKVVYLENGSLESAVSLNIN